MEIKWKKRPIYILQTTFYVVDFASEVAKTCLFLCRFSNESISAHVHHKLLYFLVFHCHISLMVEVLCVSGVFFFPLSTKSPTRVVSCKTDLNYNCPASVCVCVCCGIYTTEEKTTVCLCSVCDTPPIIPFLITSEKNTPQSQPKTSR